jgi:hypothetical protein
LDSNVDTFILNGENSSINFVGCPGILGVHEVSSSIVYLDAGGTYSANIVFGTCGNVYAGAGEAWIDFNNDEIFDTTESIGTWDGTPPFTTTFVFTVPSGMPTGISRLRLIQEEGGITPLDPCASFSWGSVMDFTLYIQNGVDCSVYPGNFSSAPIDIATLPYTDTNATDFCYISNSSIYPAPDVFYRLALGGIYNDINISLCESDYDTYVTVFDSQLNTIDANDDGLTCVPQSELTFNAFGYDTIYIAVEGWGNETGNYILNIDGNQSQLGISETTAKPDLIFPNPTSRNFQFQGEIPKSITILNNNGQIVKQINNPNSIRDVSLWKTGVYFLRMTFQNSVHHQKLIVR